MFTDKKFGIPQGLIDAVNKVHEGEVVKFPDKKKIPINDKGEKTSIPVKKEAPSTKAMKQYFKDNVKEAFVPNPKMAHHYEKGELAATVMADNDEHGNHCGHKVHFFKNGKKQEAKTYYAENEPDAHDAARQYISQGLNSLHKEEVTFSEAELAHINELLVPDTNKVAAGSVSDYFKKRSNTRLDNNKTPISSVNSSKPAATTAKPAKTLGLPAPKKTLALPKPEAKPATHSAEPIVAAHHALHAPTQQANNPKTTLTLPNKSAPDNRSGTTAADIAARQKANSSVGARKTAVDAPIPYIEGHPRNPVRGTALPTKVSADPAPKQTAIVGKTTYTTPAGKNTVSTELPKAAKSTPGKKQAGTGKVAGKKTVDLTPSVKPTAGKAVRTTKAGAPVQSQEPFRFKGGETHSKPDSIVAPEPKITRSKEAEDKKAAHAGQTSMFGTGAEVKAGTAKMFVKQQKMPDHVVDTNRSMDNLPAINRKKKVAEEFSEKELAHIKAIMEKE